MRRMCPYPSIETFRRCVQDVRFRYTCVGTDADGTPILDETRPLPTLTFTGTVKLHGSNAAVCSDGTDVWCQSRTNIVTLSADNQGFVAWCGELPGRWDALRELCDRALSHVSDADGDGAAIALHGEFCGKSIQRAVAICSLPRMFVVFDVAVWRNVPKADGKEWLPRFLTDEEVRSFACEEMGIHSIHSFPTFHMDIDFSRPGEFVEGLEAVTADVERQCPVAKQLGVEGPGEGVVWSHNADGDKRWTFKVKGESHAVAKTSGTAAIDPEQLDSAAQFVEYAVTENRLQQGLENIPALDPRHVGDFLKWVITDVRKEEGDTIAANGLDARTVGKLVERKAREYILRKIREAPL